jgi:hypothetical protein
MTPKRHLIHSHGVHAAGFHLAACSSFAGSGRRRRRHRLSMPLNTERSLVRSRLAQENRVSGVVNIG